jgi:hypothetical protein
MRLFHVNSSGALSVRSHNKSDASRIGFVTHWRNGFRRSSGMTKQWLLVQRIVKEYVDVNQWKRKSEWLKSSYGPAAFPAPPGRPTMPMVARQRISPNSERVFDGTSGHR